MLAALLLALQAPAPSTIPGRALPAAAVRRREIAPLAPAERAPSPSEGRVGVGSSLRKHGQEPHRPLSLEELATSSAVAGVAEVLRLEVRRDPETGAIYTDAHLRIREGWSAACPAEAVLTQVGGELEGRRSAIAGWNWSLAPGETVVIFAKPWKGPYVAVTGMRQGLGHVDAQGRVTWDLERTSEAPRSTTLEELRSRVGKALGRPLTAPREAPAPARPGRAPEEVAVPAPPSRPAEREGPGRGGLPFFLLAAVCVLGALILRLRRRTSGNRRA